MWTILNGTIANAVTVSLGSLVGITAAHLIAERYRTIVLHTLALVTVALGMDAAVLRFDRLIGDTGPRMADSGTYGARLALVMIGSLVIGAILGTALNLQRRIEDLGVTLHRRAGGRGSGARFAKGFLTASVIFCVGPLTLLGCLRNGASGDPSYLYIKACLDGFASIALAASLGWGVMASLLTVLGLQGGLSVLAYYFAQPLDPVSLEMMNVVGGILLLATALMMLDIKQIPVANLVPAIFLPPLLILLVEALVPGTLLPAALQPAAMLPAALPGP